MDRAEYSPPWADTSIIGVAGSSGSGKTSLAVEIVTSLNLPWVVILSMDSFYKPLTPEQSEAAFRNEFDFDSPDAIDFDLLAETLECLKQGKRADIPVYSFEKHQRQDKTVPLYSPHVLVVEGILALYDPRVLKLLDMKIFAEADADTCLARRITRDVAQRGRDIEGCIKQWFSFVKPNFERYVEPQRKNANIIVPYESQNKVAVDMIVKHIQRTLREKSDQHSSELEKLRKAVCDEPLSPMIVLVPQTPQLVAMSTIIQNPQTNKEDYIFYFDRLATLLISKARDYIPYEPKTVITPTNQSYAGLAPVGLVSAVVILRGGSAFETGLKRVLPACLTGRILIQSSYRTGEPELHFLKLPAAIHTHNSVLLLDPQMSSGGAALMAVRVLLDHGVKQENIIFVTYFAGKIAVNRLCKVYPRIKVIVTHVVEDFQERWVERRYFGC